MVRKSPAAIAAILCLFTPLCVSTAAAAANSLYQWIDDQGNVMYGDSPPALSYARQVGSGDPGSQDAAPPQQPEQVPAQPKVVASEVQSDSEQPDPRDVALEEALSKIDAMMKQVSALSGQLQSSPEPVPGPAAVPVSRLELAPTPVLGAQPLLEVAMPESQPIESRLSERERDRTRWDTESLGQRRFLERLGKIAPAPKK